MKSTFFLLISKKTKLKLIYFQKKNYFHNFEIKNKFLR